MNKSSSFEISSETLEKSFAEYENSCTESDDYDDGVNLSEFAACNLHEIKNPVKKKVAEMAQLHVQSKISSNAMQNFISILNNTPGASIEIPKNKSVFKSHFERKFEPQFYTECPSCKNVVECPGACIKCHVTVQKTRDNFFAYLPIEPQIMKSLSENLEQICEYLDRPRCGTYSDGDCAEVWKTVAKKYSNRKILSYTLNIDGGVIAEKSSRSIWPVQLYQNYLRPAVRFLPENIFVVGLYYGEKKPNVYDLLYPLLRDLHQLYETGIKFAINEIQFDFLPLLLYCSCDLPARAHIQVFKNPTGYYACPVCLHPGLPNKEDIIRVRYIKEREVSQLRSHNESVSNANSAKLNEKEYYGIKGVSCLLALPDFNIIDGFSTDYMHGVCLGTVKRLISIWLGKLKVHSSFKSMSKAKQHELDCRLKRLRPYSRINYKPRPLENQSLFRAVEYKSLLFYYLRYGLSGLIDKRYIDHFELLSASIYILCKKKIRGDEIQLAEHMLNTFCDQFETYYGKNCVTLNIHLLRHHGLIVRKTGPLWTHSLFGFETNMGVLSRYYSGGGANVIEQITEKYIIPMSINNKSPPNHIPKYFFDHKITKYDDALSAFGFDSVDGIATQISLDKTIYKSVHSNETTSIDYFLEMNDGTIGTAMVYVIKDSKIFVFLNLYTEVKQNYHLKEISATKNYSVLPFDAVKQKLIYLKFYSIEVVTVEPNLYEKS